MYHRASLAKPVKPQTNLIFLSILSGRLDLTRFSILCVSFTSLLYIAFSASHISELQGNNVTRISAGGS